MPTTTITSLVRSSYGLGNASWSGPCRGGSLLIPGRERGVDPLSPGLGDGSPSSRALHQCRESSLRGMQAYALARSWPSGSALQPGDRQPTGVGDWMTLHVAAA